MKHFPPNESKIIWLTVDLNVEGLFGNWWNSVVSFAHVFAHVLPADLGNVENRSHLVGNCEQIYSYHDLSSRDIPVVLPLHDPLGMALRSTRFQLTNGRGSP